MKIKSAHHTARNIALSAILIAISYLGAFLKLQGTIALDALPAFLGAIFLGPYYGGIIGFLGHMFTALFSGFPLTFPLHVLVALLMMGTLQVFGWLYGKGKSNSAVLLGILLNGPISLFILSVMSTWMGLPFHGKWMFFSLLLPLSIGSALNILGAVSLWHLIFIRIRKGEGR